MEDPFSSNVRFIASVSLNGTQRVLLGNGPNPCRDLLSGWKSDVAPSVRPWNACWATTMNGPLAPLRSDGLSCRSHQNFLAILSAVSTTSPPLDFVMMRTWGPTHIAGSRRMDPESLRSRVRHWPLNTSSGNQSPDEFSPRVPP